MSSIASSAFDGLLQAKITLAPMNTLLYEGLSPFTPKPCPDFINTEKISFLPVKNTSQSSNWFERFFFIRNRTFASISLFYNFMEKIIFLKNLEPISNTLVV